MLRKLFVAAIVGVGFGLLGCSAAHAQKTKVPHQGQQCKTTAASCNVKIMVEDWCIHCDVYVDFILTEVAVDHGKKGNTITWDIKDSRYEFAQQNGVDIGIVFDQNSGFSNCRRVNKQKFQCDNASKPGVHKYTVNLTGLDPLDPWVVNN